MEAALGTWKIEPWKEGPWRCVPPALTYSRPDGIELWVAEVASGQARLVLDARPSLVTEIPPQWLRDGRTLVCTLVPSSRDPEPAAPPVPAGPVIQEGWINT